MRTPFDEPPLGARDYMLYSADGLLIEIPEDGLPSVRNKSEDLRSQSAVCLGRTQSAGRQGRLSKSCVRFHEAANCGPFLKKKMLVRRPSAEPLQGGCEANHQQLSAPFANCDPRESRKPILYANRSNREPHEPLFLRTAKNAKRANPFLCEAFSNLFRIL
jgi:hypothetical protein